jgi:signal transduction histidine kinase
MELAVDRSNSNAAVTAPLPVNHSRTDELTRFQKLYELSMTLAGDPVEVFAHIARTIGELMDVNVVCLSEVVGDQLRFRSVYVRGEVYTDAGSCPLSITPCATVETSKDLRIYDRVMERFPDAGFLKDHCAFSYCGFPALDNNGKVVAVTCLLDDRPREFSEEDQHTLRIFGQRIGMEIERDHALIKLRRLNSINLALSHTNQAIVRATSQTEILERACQIAVEHGGFALAWVGLVDQDGFLPPVAIAGPARAYLDGIRVSVDERLPEGRGPSGDALRSGVHVIINNVRSSEPMRPWRERAEKFGINSSAAFPLFKAGRVIGGLAVYSTLSDQFGELEVALLDDMAANISFGLESLQRSDALDRSLELISDVEATVRVGFMRLRLPQWSLWWSAGTPDILGLPHTAVAERASLETALGPELMSIVDAALEQCTQTGRPIDIDLPVRVRQEADSWIRLFGIPRPSDDATYEISCTLKDISERKRLELEVSRVADAERRRLASELHDNLGQVLFGLSLMLTSILKEARADGTSLTNKIEHTTVVLDQAMQACRTLAHDVSPTLEGGLSDALRALAVRTASTSVNVIVAASEAASAMVTGARALELYRIVQEAISNALKHGACGRIEVELALRGSSFELSIHDDGAGADLSRPDRGPGIGLRTMRYRAARAGGTLEIRSSPGRGTTVHVRIPLLTAERALDIANSGCQPALRLEPRAASNVDQRSI